MAGVHLRLFHPRAQRRLGEIEISRDLPDAAIADLHSRTASALNSFVNDLRCFFFAMDHSGLQVGATSIGALNRPNRTPRLILVEAVYGSKSAQQAT